MEKELLIVIDQSCVDRYNQFWFDTHPRAKKARIKAPQHPSLNEYYKANFQAANTLKQTWKEFVIWLVNDLKLNDFRINQCEIKYTTFFKTNRRHDPDNVSPKFVLDGFVEAGLLEDDDYKHIVSLITECEIDKENPRMEFLITIIN